MSKVPPRMRPFIEGELNRYGHYSSWPPVFHVAAAHPMQSGVWNRGQALMMKPWWETADGQHRMQNRFMRRIAKRGLWVLFFAILVSGIIKMYYFEGEGSRLRWSESVQYVSRHAAFTIKNNPEISAALGEFVVDWPDSLIQKEFKDDMNRCGMMFALIGTRARAIVTLELSRSYRHSSSWQIVDFTVDLLDGRVFEVLPLGATFVTVESKAAAALALDVASGKVQAPIPVLTREEREEQRRNYELERLANRAAGSKPDEATALAIERMSRKFGRDSKAMAKAITEGKASADLDMGVFDDVFLQLNAANKLFRKNKADS